jgi:hypothetical protein
MKAAPDGKPQSYNHANAELVRRGYLNKNPKRDGGGLYLSTKGKQMLDRLRQRITI